MSDEHKKRDVSPSYSALTEGELLTLNLEQESLTKGAQEALATELCRRGLGEADISAFQRDEERARTRQSRWHRVQRMRLRKLFFVLLVWPGVLFIPIALGFALAFALDPVLHNWLGLSQHQTNLYEEIAAIAVVVLWFATVAALIMSERSDATIRRWMRGNARKPRSQEEKHRAHQTICPACNLASALFLLLYSLYVSLLSFRDVEGWRFLRGQPSHGGGRYVEMAVGIFVIVFCLYLLARAPCLREKLWLAFATADFLLNLPRDLLRTMHGRESGLIKGISLVLCVAATIIALSFVKSAWQEPAARNSDRQV